MNPSDERTLEGILDRTTLRGLLESIARICYAKGEHILYNWQDRPLSLIWDRAATLIEKLSKHEKIKAVP